LAGRAVLRRIRDQDRRCHVLSKPPSRARGIRRTTALGSVEGRSSPTARPVAVHGDPNDPWCMAAVATIRVLVCDDHALVRSGLRHLLESEASVAVVGEAADAEQAVERVAELRPDVLLLDVVMPGRGGIEAIADLQAASPVTRVLVLSMQDDPSYVR